MLEEPNPYQSPQTSEVLDGPAEVPARELKRIALIGWPIALTANLPVPLLLSLAVTENAGRWGMALAILVFLGLGYLICYYWPAWSKRIVITSLLMAGTQFVPILQMIAGMIALGIARQLPFVGPAFTDESSDGMPEDITSELGGFIVTTIVGGMLCAIVAGLVLSFGAAVGGIRREKRGP